MKTPHSCRLLENFIERHPSKDLIFVLTIFFVLLNPANQGEGMFLFLHLQRLSFYTLHKWLLMCVCFKTKTSINKSFAKAKEKLEQPKHNSQIASENSTSRDEEPQINSLVPPQQSSGLGALDYEAIVQNISTSFTQKKGSYQQHSKTNKLLAYSYCWFLNTDCFLWKFAKKKETWNSWFISGIYL